jgi:hypothetical protein
LAQGTVTFNSPWINLGVSSSYNYYDATGMWFRVAADPPHFVYDPMVRIGSYHYDQAPYNGTPYMTFATTGQSNYVVLSLTNGNTFGLMSVDLANPQYLSPTQQITISLNGVRADNSVVAATFTTPIGGVTNFTTFQFGSDFASGLTQVRIPSPVWAMDNLVFGNVVPEPGCGGLALLALMVFGFRAARRRWG